ncbi:MAG: LysR substrate-binding domain-containing protein [Kiloniellales bacterium]
MPDSEDRPEHKQAHLRLVIDPLVAARWLEPRLPDFRERHPEIDLAVWHDDKLPDTKKEISAVLIGDGDWPGYQGELLLELDDFPVMSPALLNGLPGLSRVSELGRFTLLHAGSTVTWQHWLTAAGAPEVDGTQGAIFDDAEDCLAAAVEGEGVALANELSVALLLMDGSLVKALPVTVPSRQAVYLVTAPDADKRPGVAAFRQWLGRELRRRAAT